MKKLMFTLAAIAVAFTSANAQKQLGGEHNVEVSFNPFGASPINASVIKYRNFLDDDAALRVTLGLNNTSNSFLVVPENSLQEAGATGTLTHPDLFLTNNHSRLDIGVGYERHFRGTDNLSPYMALAAGFSMNSLTLQRERFSALNLDGGTVNTGFWEDEPDPANWGVWSYANEIKSSSFNVDLLFGADYYFNDAIYVGFEAGLRFSQTSGITSTITASDNNAFNIYFDGGSGDENSSNLVQNTVTGGTGFQWNSATDVNYIINGEPWLGDGVNSVNPNGGPADQAAYIAADGLWSDWVEQSPATQDALIDSPRDAFFNGSNFLGTYTTGMLRIGFLFE
ncbi:MAG TPA: hypothetical protein DCS71_03790 [Flavobacteriales bacterium]|nr:hypothetical protein [Flavobacteriales bacterium]